MISILTPTDPSVENGTPFRLPDLEVQFFLEFQWACFWIGEFDMCIITYSIIICMTSKIYKSNCSKMGWQLSVLYSLANCDTSLSQPDKFISIPI